MRNKGKSKEQRNSSRECRYSDEKHHASKTGEDLNSQTNPRGSSSNSQENSLTPPRLPSTVTIHNGNKVNQDTKDTYKSPKDLNPNTMEFDRVVKLLYPEFLTDYLKKTLAFLKGRTKEICFPHVGTLKEAFLVRIAKERQNLYSKALNECCGSLCRDILKELEVNRNSYKWIHSYESGMIRKRVLVYQKVNVNSRQEPQDSRFKMPLASSSSDTNTRNWYPTHTHFAYLDDDEDGQRNMSRDVDRNLLQRMTNGDRGPSQLLQEQEQFNKMFDALSVPFIMSSLQQILDFVEDNSRNSLILDAKSVPETKFFKTLPTFLYKESLYPMNKECVQLLVQLKRVWNRGGLTVKCINSKREKRQVGRIQITKRRTGNNQSESGRNKWPNRKSRRGRKDGDHNAFLKALSVSADSDDSDGSYIVDSIKSVVSAAHSIDSIYSTPDTDTRRTSPRYQQKPGIQWQPEGHSGLSPTEDKPATDRGRHPQRRSKLQEALSVPVEPDKAMRMMRLMGWSGGALGTRGDGITEPIMPAIDIVSGAGLGHTHSPTRRKPKERHRDKRKTSNSRRTPSDFRREILQNVLGFLRNQNLMEKEIELPEAVGKKERRFIRTFFQALNARKNVGLNSEDEKDMICRIMSNLNCKPKMGIDYKLCDDKKKFTLMKIEGRLITSKRNKKKFQPTPAFITQPPIDIELSNDCDHVTDVDIDNLVDKLRQTSRKASKKSLTALAYRIVFLKKIYSFVVSKEEERLITFKEFLTNRQINYVKNVIDSVNSKVNASYATRTENVFYQDIKGQVPTNVALQAIFAENFRSFKLRRIEYKRRFINTSKSATSTNLDEHAQSNDDTNDRDTHCDNDEGIHDDRNYDVELFDEHGEVNDNRDTVVLSDSDDSVISLECEFDLADDESDYDDNGDDDKGDERTYREDQTEYGDRRSSVNDDQTDNISEIAVVTDRVSLDDSQDRSYGDSKALFEITDVKSIAKEKPITESNENSEEMASRVKTISINEDINRHTNESMDSDVEEIVTEIPIIDLDSEENINYSDIKSVESRIIESQNNHDSLSNDKNTETNLFESRKIENGLDFHEKEHFDENPSPGSSKRSRTDSESSDSVAKKKKRDISEENYVAIIPNNPDKVIDREVAGKIQEEILRHLERNNELPYLECNGIIDGSLHYKCFDEKSLHWLDNIVQKLTICDSSFIVIPSSEDVIRRRKSKIKMAAKTHSFLRENPKRILELINVYNPNIRTNEWVVLEEKICDESVIFIVDIDYDSFESIAKANYSVFAGIDKVDFSRVWT